MSQRDEEVDDFGRIIKRDRQADGNTQSNNQRRESFDDRRHSGGQRSFKQSRFSQHDDTSSSRFQQNNSWENRGEQRNRQHQPQYNNNRRYSEDGTNQHYRTRSPQRSYHQQDYHQDHVVSSSENAPVPTGSRITPFMTFKSFVQTLNDDLSGDMYQKLYSQYHMHYLDDFSKAFFEASKSEEWFQDRYNPIRIVERENEVKVWAAKESAELKLRLQTNASAHIAGMNLDLPEKTSTSKGDGVAPAATTTNTSAGEDSDRDDSDDEGEGKVRATDDDTAASATPAVVGANAAHIDGHADRTIMIHHIHACCPKELFRSVITEQLTKKDLPAPERIIISDPNWSKKNREKFERTAWLVMPAASQVSLAVHHLEGLSIEVPGPPHTETGERLPLFHFTISAAVRRVRTDLTVQSNVSHPERVKMDTERSARLAALLDEDRGVPVDSRLSVILDLPQVVAACVKPTDRLDLSIAYLRRVHFVAFYGAVRCNSEADMLLRASHSLFRSVPCSLSVEAAASLSTAAESGRVIASETDTTAAASTDEAETAATVSKKRRLSESEDAPDETTVDAPSDETAVAADPTAASPAKPVAIIAQSGRVNLVDRKVEAMILEVKKKLDLKKDIEEGSVPAQGDEFDAAVLQRLTDEEYQQSVAECCQPEKDNKARCCYIYCKKLFKDVDFLTRHLKAKHEYFARDKLIALAEPFMRARFEREDLSFRPLPPVEVEGSNDLLLVRDIIIRYQNHLNDARRAARNSGGDNRRQDNNRQGGGYGRDINNNADRRRAGGEGRGGDRSDRGNRVDHSQRGSDDRDRRAATGSFRPPEQENEGYEERRKLPVFMDVDAPKESVGAVDYGVSLPPPVKRRKSAGGAAVAAAVATAAPTAAAASIADA